MIDEEARELAIAAAQAAEAQHATDVIILHVGDVLGVTEYFVVASASNKRLVNAVVDGVEARLKIEPGRSPIRVEGFREQQRTRFDRMAPHVESTGADGVYEVIEVVEPG